MGKILDENTTIYMRETTFTICYAITKYIKSYIKENRTLERKIDIKIRDAVLTDFINFIGREDKCAFHLTPNALYKDEAENLVFGIFYPVNIEPYKLLRYLKFQLGDYMFNQRGGKTITDSILQSDFNDVNDPFDATIGALVLTDFLNYVAEVNEYDNVFTIRGIYDSTVRREKKKNMEELKDFLFSVETYMEIVKDPSEVQETVRALEETIAYAKSEDVNDYEMYSKAVATLYAISYAYWKTHKSLSGIPALDAKIEEMRIAKRHV